MLELALVFCVIAAIAPVLGATALAKTALVIAVVALAVWAVGGMLAYVLVNPEQRRILHHA